jgi:hypothetical protein
MSRVGRFLNRIYFRWLKAKLERQIDLGKWDRVLSAKLDALIILLDD